MTIINQIGDRGDWKRIPYDKDLIARINREAEEKSRRGKLPVKPTEQRQNQAGKGEINDKWVYVPLIDMSFARQRTHQNTNWYDQNKALISENLLMPTPEQTWELIFYLKDNLDNPEHREVYDDILKRTPKDIWHGENQNAYFTKEGDKFYIQHIKGIKSNGELVLTNKVEISDYLNSDCWADISSKANITDKGLCKTSSSIQNYSQGNNIYFWQPRNNSVARFYAGSDRVDLDCGRNPENAGASLGVRGCAEGAK
ncbi:MAG: hypothetical protein WC438_04765 [Candidatus Pacearchaeota archaeon]